MGVTDFLDGQSLTTRQIGIIIVGWLLLVSAVSILLLVYTHTLSI